MNKYVQQDELKKPNSVPSQLPPPPATQYGPPGQNPYEYHYYAQPHMTPQVQPFYPQPSAPLRHGLVAGPAPPGPAHPSIKSEDMYYAIPGIKQGLPHPNHHMDSHSSRKLGDSSDDRLSRPTPGIPGVQHPQNTQSYQQPMPVPALPTSPAIPRKRLLTACDACRQKKIKCDNMRPKCGSCMRNGIAHCNYRAGASPGDFDSTSVSIVSKLDLILEELRGDGAALPQRRRKRARTERSTHFQHCLWDMSFTQIIKWRNLQEVLGTLPVDAAGHQRMLLGMYEETNLGFPLPYTFQERFAACTAVERLLHTQIPVFMNSFLLNCHAKVPCLDIVTLIESLEVYTLLKRSEPALSFTKLLQEFDALSSVQPVGRTYIDAVAKFGVHDSPIRRRAYRTLCESIPLLLVICAIGALATSVKLDNIGTYDNSLEERADPLASAGTAYSDPLVPKDRLKLSQSYITYALIISTVFPTLMKANTLISVEYHILLNQYHLYTMNPMQAHEHILKASTQIMYYLEKLKLPETGQYELGSNSSVVDRLFWTCLKLECELRAELSPFVPLSGITQMTPPSPFLRIPGPINEEDHLSEAVTLAGKYDSHYLWSYFLTEIAVRKVDNNLFDKLYAADAISDKVWDSTEFAERDVWTITIKFLNQYNGIVNSLSPQIRKFVLLEANVEQIYSSMKKRADRKKKLRGEEEVILESLDDFLIDEDLLLRAQSESVMFIKTRIITSKMALLKPIIYLILEDRIEFGELLEAAASILPQAKLSQLEKTILHEPEESLQSTTTPSVTNENTDSSSAYISVTANFLGEDMTNFDMASNMRYAPQLHNRFPEDDFSDLIDVDGSEDKDDFDFAVKDYAAARKRILKVFVRSFISLPKLNIPKIGLHRHGGSWFYIRNLVCGVLWQYLLYKKVQKSVVAMMTASEKPGGQAPSMELLEALNAVFSRETIKATLEHTLLIIGYWKKERKDCVVYGDYIQRCLDRL